MKRWLVLVLAVAAFGCAGDPDRSVVQGAGDLGSSTADTSLNGTDSTTLETPEGDADAVADLPPDAKLDMVVPGEDVTTCVPLCNGKSCNDGCGGTCETKVCDDGNGCTTGDTCVGAQCAGKPITCDDKNACTTDSCDAALGCKFMNNTSTCDDSNPCTVGDTCQDGICGSGKSKGCDSGSACVVGSCNLADGKCQFQNAKDGLLCSDASACTTGDVCLAGDCSGTKLNCDDANVCTDDTCDGAIGCSHTLNSASCEDGNGCTLNDTCVNKDCISGNQKSCDDKSPCTKDSCNVMTGGCVHNGSPFEWTTCDADGSVCTKSDSCISGVCTPGAALACDDGSGCTDDICDAKTGCSHIQNTAPCDADSNACSVGDTCASGSCVVGKLNVCNDNNPCTTDMCDPKSGNCVFDFAATDGIGCNFDDSLCTAADSCKSGSCAPGPKLKCDDNNVCTDDGCSPTTGCLHTPNTSSCNADDNPCTVGDACSKEICLPGKTNACSDGNSCTVDTCDTKTGTCVFSAGADGAACDADGSSCTPNDKCKAGQCAADKLLNCNDGNGCTDDSCDPKAGCVHVNNTASCDDGDGCTVSDACQSGVCKAGIPKVCGITDVCKLGTCVPSLCAAGIPLEFSSWTFWSDFTGGVVAPAPGSLEKTVLGLKFYATAYRQAGTLWAVDKHDLTNKTVYAKWLCNGQSTFMQCLPTVTSSAGVPAANEFLLAFMSTGGSYLGSYVVSADTWYYTRAVFKAGSFTAFTASGNYDDQGGQTVDTRTGNLPTMQLYLRFRHGDPYGGKAAYMTVGEAKICP